MQITKYDLIWSYIGYILRFFSGIIVLPILVLYLTSDELGIWYVFLSLGAMTQLLDMGFAPTISRNVAYAYSGATDLIKKGVPEADSGEPNLYLLKRVIAAAAGIYRWISIATLAILVVAGLPYIAWLARDFADIRMPLASWGMYALGLFLNFYYSYWGNVLTGIGRIKEGQKAVIVSRAIYLLLLVIGVQFIDGLFVVSTAFCISGVTLRWMYRWEFRKAIRLPEGKVDSSERKRLFQIMWYNAKRMGLVSLGAFLINQANTLIASYYFDLATVASYGLTIQIVGILMAISSLPSTTFAPKFSELQLLHKRDELIAVLSKVIVFFILIYWIGGVVILGLTNPVLELVHSHTFILTGSQTLLVLVFSFLESNHSIFAGILAARNEIPFVSASLAAGAMLIVFAIFNMEVLQMNIWGLLMARFFSQAVYQNWYWPYYVMKGLQVTPIHLLTEGWQGVKQEGAKFYRSRVK